jgi:SOS response regulatory protein OraA/RecX
MPSVQQDELAKARAVALRMLRASAKLGNEVRARLTERGFGPDVIERILTELHAKKVLNDAVTLDAAVASAKRRGYGVDHVRASLLRRGAREEDVEAALQGIDEREQQAIAESLLAERPAYKSRPKRAIRLLESRGFDEDTVRTVIERLYGADWEQEDAD